MPTKTFFNLDKAKQQRIFLAAVDEFAQNNYEHAKLSHIIKQSKIPRGSFYQYFTDKFDLYTFLIDKIGQEKMTYVSDTLLNPQEIPFLELFRELYKVGLRFALDNPKYVEISSHLLSKKDDIYEKVMRKNLDLALSLYTQMIIKDKERGLIHEDVNPEVLAKIVLDLTVNVSFDSVIASENTINIDKMNETIDQIMMIFEKGIKKGE